LGAKICPCAFAIVPDHRQSRCSLLSCWRATYPALSVFLPFCGLPWSFTGHPLEGLEAGSSPGADLPPGTPSRGVEIKPLPVRAAA